MANYKISLGFGAHSADGTSVFEDLMRIAEASAPGDYIALLYALR